MDEGGEANEEHDEEGEEVLW